MDRTSRGFPPRNSSSRISSRAPPGHQRWEARANPQKTAAPQRPRDHGVAHGRHIVAAQPVGARRVLSTDRSATRRRCRRVCHRTEARPMGLPRAAWGQPYVDEGAAVYEHRYRQARITRLAATAKDLGYALVSVEA